MQILEQSGRQWHVEQLGRREPNRPPRDPPAACGSFAYRAENPANLMNGAGRSLPRSRANQPPPRLRRSAVALRAKAEALHYRVVKPVLGQDRSRVLDVPPIRPLRPETHRPHLPPACLPRIHAADAGP